MSRLKFQVLQDCKDTSARTARFTTLHGEVRTPIFMPVGTQATVKGLTVESLKQAGSRVLLANTYHLLLRPGIEVFRKFSGIHKFMNWDGPVLTDSGGFQIFSFENSRKITEHGAEFKSYVDGTKHLLSPEKSIETQKAIGSDIMMVLDQCVPSTSDYKIAESALHLTQRWAQRSLDARGDSPQSLFGIVQGACFADLRKQSAEQLCAMNFDGFAIGGLAVGESKNQRDDFTELTASLLPKNLPRYLMGVGTPLDILEAVHRGVDMFDCSIPSMIAKRGTAFTSKGKVHIYRGVYKFSEAPLDPACACLTCTNFSRAYLHHLIKSDEVLGWKLMSKHNLYFYHRMMNDIQNHISSGSFLDYARERQSAWAEGDSENPMNPPKTKRFRGARNDSSADS